MAKDSKDFAVIISAGKGSHDGGSSSSESGGKDKYGLFGDDDKDGDKDSGDYSPEFEAACDEIADALGITDPEKRTKLCEGLAAAITAGG